MESTRSAAKLAGNNVYFTGRPCSNGHLSYRYTQSGTCSMCVNPARGVNVERHETILKGFDAQRAAEIERHEAALAQIDKKRAAEIERHEAALKLESDKRQVSETRAALEGMSGIRVPIHTDDLETVGAILYAFVVVRVTTVTPEELEPVKIKRVPALYNVKCHPDDATEVRRQIEELYARRVNVEALREECLKRLPG